MEMRVGRPPLALSWVRAKMWNPSVRVAVSDSVTVSPGWAFAGDNSMCQVTGEGCSPPPVFSVGLMSRASGCESLVVSPGNFGPSPRATASGKVSGGRQPLSLHMLSVMEPPTVASPSAARLKTCRQTTRPMCFSWRKSTLPILVTSTLGGWSGWGSESGASSPA